MFRCMAIALISFATSTSAYAGTVQYRLDFEATWTPSQLVSGALPPGAHFTPLIGASHRPGEPLWQAGTNATLGIENGAELGFTLQLERAIQALIATGPALEQVLIRQNLFAGNFPQTATTTFSADDEHSSVTLISMIAPSPDWFVGVSNLALQQNGTWIPELTVDLHPYDAGTESGNGFSLSNPATNPQQPVSLLSGAPFVGQPVIGTFRLTLVPEPGLLSLMLLAFNYSWYRRRAERRKVQTQGFQR